MASNSIEVTTHIDNTPEAVIRYIADPKHRPLYLGPLKSITDVQGDVAGTGATWRWTWATLGMEFEGVGRCTRHEPGKVYAFRTEGGIESTWTYTAEADGQGARLTIRVDYEVPERARPILPTGSVAESMKKAEADRVIQNLKHILDR